MSLVNTFTQYTVQQAEQTAVELLLENLGIELLGAEVVLPLWPFIALGGLIYDIFSLFSGGRPKFQDTDALIAAYNQSAYWPLHALASDLQIAAKNGAPISDSNPAIQAQFSAWKQGTIQSIQSFAHQTPGPTGNGYWQLQQLIDLSWDWSSGGQGQVLQAVKAIDQMTIGLSLLSSQTTTTSGTGGGGGGGSGGGGTGSGPIPCQSDNDNQDEILDLCNALQQAIGSLATTISGTGEDSTCCAAVVQAIASVASQLGIIAASISTPSTPSAPVDLSGVVGALQTLVNATLAYMPTAEAIGTLLSTGLNNIAKAVSSAPAFDTSGIVNTLNQSNLNDIIPAAVTDYWVQNGIIQPALAQLFSDRPWPWLHTALAGAASISPIIGWVERYLGDTADAEAGWRMNYNRMQAWTKAGIDALTGFTPATNPKTIGQLGALLKAYVGATDKTIQPVLEPFINTILGQLKANGPTSIANIGVDPDTPVATAAGIALTAGAAAWLLSFAGIDEGESLTHIAELIGGLLGFEELKDVQLRPLISHGIEKVATMNAKAMFQQELPGHGELAALAARSLITAQQYFAWVPFTGLPGQLQQQNLANAYKPINPRAIASLIADTPFDTAQMQAVLQDNSLSPANVQFLLGLLQYNSTKNVRNSYINEAQTAYGDGVVSDEEFQQVLTNAGWSTEAINFATQKALLQRRIRLAAQTESYIVPEVVAGLLTAEEGLNALEASGVQPWYAQLKITLAQTRAQLNLNKKELAAEAKLANQRNRAGVKAAIADFRNGNINSVALEAALLAANQDPLITTLTVATETAIQQGKLKFVYEQLLTPEAAKVLSDQVAALAAQATHLLIDPTTAQAQLQALHVPQPEVTALIARWFASQTKPTEPEQLLPIK